MTEYALYYSQYQSMAHMERTDTARRQLVSRIIHGTVLWRGQSRTGAQGRSPCNRVENTPLIKQPAMLRF